MGLVQDSNRSRFTLTANPLRIGVGFRQQFTRLPIRLTPDHPVFGQPGTSIPFGNFLPFTSHPLENRLHVPGRQIQPPNSHVHNLDP